MVHHRCESFCSYSDPSYESKTCQYGPSGSLVGETVEGSHFSATYDGYCPTSVGSGACPSTDAIGDQLELSTEGTVGCKCVFCLLYIFAPRLIISLRSYKRTGHPFELGCSCSWYYPTGYYAAGSCSFCGLNPAPSSGTCPSESGYTATYTGVGLYQTCTYVLPPPFE
jgi:hypothetical protein